ncbi:MAG: cation:proton antiporter [Pseudonocardia sp.]
MGLKEIIPFVLLDVAIVVAAARLMGRLFRRIGQPAVIGEIMAGIVLGPTLLGLLPGGFDTVLFPTEVRPYLSVIAQLGLALFMFIVGLEVDLSLIRGRERAAGAIAVSSIVLPFALGAGVGVLLYPSHTTVDGQLVAMPAFVLFIGVAMSITALPVLARILAERGMQRTPIGVLSLACAAIDDVIGWSLLAIVVAVAAGGSMSGAALIIALTIAFALVAFLVVRPLLARMVGWYERAGRLTPDMLAVILVGLFLSAWITEEIGVHAIFGAFIFGAIMPRRGATDLTREILERLEQISLLLLLPVFFVVAGLQVNVGAIGIDGLWQLGLILLAAIIGKFVGAAAAARTQRMPRRQATAIGLLMNTRGLTEIVILQVGVQLGILDPTMFTLMVIMALVTTTMTGPLVRRAYPDRALQRDIATADRDELGEVDAYTVLVLVPDAERTPVLAQLARQLVGREQPARVILCRLLPAQVQLEVASGLGAELAMIASAGDQLRRLARELEARGDVRCSVIVRFSNDPVTDLTTLAETVTVDVVLVPKEAPTGTDTAQPAGGAALPAIAGAAGAVVRLGSGSTTDGRVVALVDGSAGGRATLRLAAQAALAQGEALVVGSTDSRRAARRAGAAVEALRRRGIDVTPLEDDAVDTLMTGILVLPADAGLPTGLADGVTVLRVQPSDVDSDDDLDQAVGRISLTAAPAPDRTPSA